MDRMAALIMYSTAALGAARCVRVRMADGSAAVVINEDATAAETVAAMIQDMPPIPAQAGPVL
jgi:hypothetical protein